MNRRAVWLLVSGLCISGTLSYVTWGGFQPATSPSLGSEPMSVKKRRIQSTAYSSNAVIAELAAVKETSKEFTKLVASGQKHEAVHSAEAETPEADLCARFLWIAELRDQGERDLKLQEFAATLSGEENGRILDRLVEMQSKPSVNELRNAFVRLWTESEPASAAEWVMHLPASEAAGELLNQVAISWVNDDLDSAVHWVEKLPDGDRRKNVIRTVISAEGRKNAK